MRKIFHRYKNSLVCIFNLFFLIIVISAQVKNESGHTILGSMIFDLLTPVQVTTSKLIKGFKEKWEAYTNLTNLYQENQCLKQEVKDLQYQLLNYNEIKINNDRLAKVLDFNKRLQFPVVFAEIVAFDSSNFSHTITIDKGSSHGLDINMPVISAEGVIGKIIKVTAWASQVQLIIDGNSALAAMDQRSRVRGVVVGLGKHYCNLKYVDLLQDVAPGDIIITSGEDNIFPKGLIIGKTATIRKKDSILQEIHLIPSVPFQKLEEVAVLIKKGGVSPYWSD
jgi:rod shape-determining protein MreC